MLLNIRRDFYTDTNEVIKIAIWKPFDIQIHRRAFKLYFRAANNVDFLLPDRQRFERMIESKTCAFWSAARSERVGELSDTENTPAVKAFALFRRHTRHQAEIVFFNCLLTASESKFALDAMLI